jgi:hypothetical protein
VLFITYYWNKEKKSTQVKPHLGNFSHNLRFSKVINIRITPFVEKELFKHRQAENEGPRIYLKDHITNTEVIDSHLPTSVTA